MKKIKIEEIITLFKDQFSIGWLDRLNWSDDNASQDSYDQVHEKVSSFDEDVFFLLAQSVLSGEYLVRPGIHDALNNLYDLLSNAEIFYCNSGDFKSIAILEFNDLTYELQRIIDGYRYILSLLKGKYEERQIKYIVNAYRVSKNESSGSKFSRFYDILLDVTQYDHLLSLDTRTIKDLILFHSDLEEGIKDVNIKNKNILALKIINEKCLFLLKKLLIEDSKEFDFLIDFEKKHYDTSKFIFSYFSSMDRKFEFYRAGGYNNDDSIGRNLDISARNKTLKIGGYALLMKYYKDSNVTQKIQINNIFDDFNADYKVLSERFTKRPLDVYALSTLKNFMYNSRFSYKLKSDNYGFEDLRKDLDEIIDIQYQTEILNFYPFRKAFNKILVLLRSDKMLSMEEISEYKKLLKLCVEKFSEAIEWCKTYRFYPIQNVYAECITRVKDFGVVFMASSFCRPVKYEKLRDELRFFKNQMLLVDNEIALREEKEQLKSLKNDIDNSKRKEVEILSFFTAVITFLFGTIGFFANNDNNDFLHLIFSIVGLGAILMIFVSGIHLVTMRKEKNVIDYFIHPRAWFCFITLFCSFGLIIWLVCHVNTLPLPVK